MRLIVKAVRLGWGSHSLGGRKGLPAPAGVNTDHVSAVSGQSQTACRTHVARGDHCAMPSAVDQLAGTPTPRWRSPDRFSERYEPARCSPKRAEFGNRVHLYLFEAAGRYLTQSGVTASDRLSSDSHRGEL